MQHFALENINRHFGKSIKVGILPQIVTIQDKLEGIYKAIRQYNITIRNSFQL